MGSDYQPGDAYEVYCHDWIIVPAFGEGHGEPCPGCGSVFEQTDVVDVPKVNDENRRRRGGPMSGYDVTKDGEIRATGLTHNEAFAYILESQGQSVHYATTYGGWEIVSPGN